jgi:hypothetical protein
VQLDRGDVRRILRQAVERRRFALDRLLSAGDLAGSKALERSLPKFDRLESRPMPDLRAFLEWSDGLIVAIPCEFTRPSLHLLIRRK